jgi:hypothetical protein
MPQVNKVTAFIRMAELEDELTPHEHEVIVSTISRLIRAEKASREYKDVLNVSREVKKLFSE